MRFCLSLNIPLSFLMWPLVYLTSWNLPKSPFILYKVDQFRHHSFSTYTKFVEKLIFLPTSIRTFTCAYQRVKNVKFSKSFLNVPSGLSLLQLHWAGHLNWNPGHHTNVLCMFSSFDACLLGGKLVFLRLRHLMPFWLLGWLKVNLHFHVKINPLTPGVH